jgi:hypothetical protein
LHAAPCQKHVKGAGSTKKALNSGGVHDLEEEDVKFFELMFDDDSTLPSKRRKNLK